MTTSDMIRELCNRKSISLAELCRKIGQTPQNFNKKLQRETVSFEEMLLIAKTLNVGYEQVFILEDQKVGISILGDKDI
ncbi:XRE family transcriptional regulator [Pseudoflavonifractor sp. SW1122]|uniref:helix-turn-helix domain-containing protein n=1 Tax=Pseudoflavonifractor sp. SW1122 TaxID=2530044 RepID=UPI00143AF494|nr:helix-turn-helix transcriptional regulator [Pseudoflavonifractor sp. SW1122]NJE73742.1 XRE family transcriptional regulator [Pseudoflavonifractor sp. SW1122]